MDEQIKKEIPMKVTCEWLSEVYDDPIEARSDSYRRAFFFLQEALLLLKEMDTSIISKEIPPKVESMIKSIDDEITRMFRFSSIKDRITCKGETKKCSFLFPKEEEDFQILIHGAWEVYDLISHIGLFAMKALAVVDDMLEVEVNKEELLELRSQLQGVYTPLGLLFLRENDVQ